MKKLIRPPRRLYPFTDLTGVRFARVVVQWPVGRRLNKNPVWLCLCDCGHLLRADLTSLRKGAVKSCGCFQRELRTKHGIFVGRGNKTTPEYRSWTAMLHRCTNSKHMSYHRYGGRGIMVCERWKEFANFLADMGLRPMGKSLDRINNDGNYEPGNCRWATPKEQQANRGCVVGRTAKIKT